MKFFIILLLLTSTLVHGMIVSLEDMDSRLEQMTQEHSYWLASRYEPQKKYSIPAYYIQNGSGDCYHHKPHVTLELQKLPYKSEVIESLCNFLKGTIALDAIPTYTRLCQMIKLHKEFDYLDYTGIQQEIKTAYHQRLTELATHIAQDFSLKPESTVKRLNRESNVHCIAWSLDGTRLASGAKDGTIHVWHIDYVPGTCTLKGHTEQILSVAWSYKHELASSGNDATVRIWDTATKKERICLQHPNVVGNIAWHPTQNILATSCWDSKIRLWNTLTNTVITSFEREDEDCSLAWHSDGIQLALASFDPPKVTILNTQTQEFICIIDNSKEYPTEVIQSVSWSPNGNYFAIIEGNIRLFSSNSYKQIDMYCVGEDFNDEGADEMSWSPDSKHFVLSTTWGRVCIWDVACKKIVHTLQNNAIDDDIDDCFSISTAWNPKGTSIAYGGDDKQITLVPLFPINTIVQNLYDGRYSNGFAPEKRNAEFTDLLNNVVAAHKEKKPYFALPYNEWRSFIKQLPDFLGEPLQNKQNLYLNQQQLSAERAHLWRLRKQMFTRNEKRDALLYAKDFLPGWLLAVK